MEQQFNNVINFGIGCFKALSGEYAQISERVRTGVNNLIQDGEKANSNAAVKIREVAIKATHLLNRGKTGQKVSRAS